MASEVGIVNSALLLLGDSTITSFDEASNRAILAKQFYAEERDALLRAHPWNFAMSRATLAALTTAPLGTEWDAQYTLPTDPKCLRVIKLDESEDEFKVENGKLLTNIADAVTIIYVAQITDPDTFDSLFVAALTARLAATLALPVTGDSRIQDAMWKLYAGKMREARTVNGQENYPQEFVSNDLTDVR